MYELVPTVEPVWPLLAISSAAALLIGITYWTYKDARPAKGGKVWVLVLLRLLALGVACLALVRPTWVKREVLRQPVSLVVLVDASKSMLVKDELSLSRFEALRRDVQVARNFIRQLQEEKQVQIIFYAFDTRLRELKLDDEPAGESSAVLSAVHDGFEQHKPFDSERSTPLLGIILMSDGRDNVGKPPLDSLVAKLARAPCPVHTIGFGYPGGSELQPDLIALDIQAPGIARIKDRLEVRGSIQAQRFVHQDVEVWLMIDGKPAVQADDATKPVRIVVKPENAMQLIPVRLPDCKLPDIPGEVRLSLLVKPMPGELTDTNNEVSTYVTLTKEGLSVLYLDKDRAWEPKYLSRALKYDERITLYHDYLYHDKLPQAAGERQKLREALDKTAYDVIILGDIPASRFDADLLARIEKKVEAGTGLLMIGGHDSFGSGGWRRTVVEKLLPVELNVQGQLEGPGGNQREVKFVPTEDGLDHFAMRLESDRARNAEWWNKLPPLDGGNVLGAKKERALVLARSDRQEILFAISDYGKGRTAALAVDTTWRWHRPGPPRDPKDANKRGVLSESAEAHLRFWRQLILWLARQEDAGKSVRLELDHRRLAAGKEQGITVQARELTPGGARDLAKPLKDAEFAVKIIGPNKKEVPVVVSPDGAEGKSRGLFWKTEEPGEYLVTANAKHQGADLGTVQARFMTYRDDNELLNRAANHSLLKQLSDTTGGKHLLHGGLKDLLQEIDPQSITETTALHKIPNWQESSLWPPLVLFILFVGLVGAEWLLRRWWGLI